MDPIRFQNKTVYDRRTLEKLNQTANWAATKKDKPMNRILSMVLPLTFLGSGVYIVQSHGAVPIAIAEIILGCFLLVWIPFFHRFQAWLSSKLMLKGDPVFTLDLYEDGYVVSSTTTHGEPSERFSYATVMRLYETTEYFVLLLNKRSGYILNKNGFLVGSAGGFRSFIEEKTGETFRRFAL